MAAFPVRTLVFGNPFPEPLTHAEVRTVGATRAFFVLGAVGLNVLVAVLFRGSVEVRPGALQLISVVNISLLSTNVVMALASYRWVNGFTRGYGAWVAPLFDALAALLWVQLTGSLSSYFIVFELMLIFIWRIQWGYAASALCASVFFTGHALVFLAEEVGWLTRVSILRELPGGLYALQGYRIVAIVSILYMIPIGFALANYLVNATKAKDKQLEEAHREVERVAGLVQQGRLSGTTLRGYRLSELLGRGGMGEVYAAKAVSGQPVAIKVLHSHLAHDPEAFARFLRESEVAKKVSGVHAPNVYEIAQTPEGPMIVMECLVGEDLGAFLRRKGTLHVGEAVDLVVRVAAALDAVHEAGVVHRDLKPTNIFLLGDGSVRLLDFGIARWREAVSGLTTDGQILGTPGYMAPEAVGGATAEGGTAADVFALGVVAYRAFTGGLPFSGRTPFEILQQVNKGGHRNPSEVAPGGNKVVDAVFAKVLAHDPSQRYASAGQFARDLADAVAGNAVEAPSLQALDVDRFLSEPSTLALVP